MPRIRVVTDSTCDLPDTLLRQFEIAVVPFSAGWGNEVYRDGPGANLEDLVRRMRAVPTNPPDLNAPSIEEFTRVYRSVRETCDGILSLHASARLTEAFANASAAREAFGPVGQGGFFPISVVDSQSLSMGLGWLVILAARAARSGMDLARLSAMVSRMSGQTHFAFFTEYLDGLQKCVKGTRLAGQWDGLAGMKPLFHLDEGQVVVYERTRTRAKARDALYNFVEDFPKIGELAVLHTGAQSDVEHLLTRVGAIYPRERVLVTQPGIAVSTILGADAVGVAVIEGED